MIQIVCCSYTQQKFRNNDVDFNFNKRFYQNIDKVFVAPCLRHSFFKERIGSRFSDVKCNCERLEKGCCNNCKIICFNLNSFADKIKIARFIDVPAKVEIKIIEQYLAEIKSMLFFYFCHSCFKV